MTWITLIGSLAAVFALAAVAWFLGMGKTPRIGDVREAEQLARDAHSGFKPVETALSRDGRAALIAGDDGDFVLVRGHGANMVARVLRDVPHVEREDAIIRVGTGERLFGNVRLDLDEAEAARWFEKLAEPRLETADE